LYWTSFLPQSALDDDLDEELEVQRMTQEYLAKKRKREVCSIKKSNINLKKFIYYTVFHVSFICFFSFVLL
jgi:hypothetical protein